MDPRVRVRPADLHARDQRDLLERDARRWDLREVTDPDGPLFGPAYALLAEGFGADELETAPAIRGFLREDPFATVTGGTLLKYTLLLARDASGAPCGVRDAVLLANPAVAPDLCVVYLARIYVPPRSRGTTLSSWLRSAPIEVADAWLEELGARGLLVLPEPGARERHFGMRLLLVAEMEPYAPAEPTTGRRLLWYGRGGYAVLSPRVAPYLQPDFREPADVAATGPRPLPYLLVVRRLGREAEPAMPLAEARALLRLLHDDFASWCAAEVVRAALGPALEGLARATADVELLPLPTGPEDLDRLVPLSRASVYDRCYRGTSPVVDEVLASEEGRRRADPAWLAARIAELAGSLRR